MRRLLQKAHIWLLIFAVVILYLTDAVLALRYTGVTMPNSAWFEQAAHICSEMAAAIIVSLVAVFLVDKINRDEVTSAVEIGLRQGIDLLTSSGARIEKSVSGSLDHFVGLQQDFRAEMQAASMCHRMFGHDGNKMLINAINQRILRTPILRLSQDISCTLRHQTAGDETYIEMICGCRVIYQNLSDTPRRQGFRLSIDRAIALPDASKTLQFLKITPLDDLGNPLQSQWIDIARDLEEMNSTEAAGTYTISDKPESPACTAFTIPAKRSVEHAYAYKTRQPSAGREDFCMRDATVRMTVRVPVDTIARYGVRLEPQTDLPIDPPREEGTDWVMQIGPVLLPMQGIVMHWREAGTTSRSPAGS